MSKQILEKPLVSIIIPTYNRAHLISETLDSVLAQTYRNWECIIVDDGSTDDTDEVLSKYVAKDLRFHHYQRPKSRPKGANACRNYGFELSKGEFVNWFDDDDLMLINHLEFNLINMSDNHINCSIGQALKFNSREENRFSAYTGVLKFENTLSNFIRRNIVWYTPTVLLKKSFLESNQIIFDEELMAAQEWEFYCKVLNVQSVTVKIHDKNTVLIREHTKSITYSDLNKKRHWHYFLARVKVYRNKQIRLKANDKLFLEEYFINSFKFFCRKGLIIESIKSFMVIINQNNSLSFFDKIFLFTGMVSYLVFNKGDKFFHCNSK
ncbi:glycosyltransferase family 2 protein [Leeuwenhoekiella marinoflava]|uniref:glycosyltransferase family 2 protein n=1 Tax=Leeuwenhoekiella marinoflava TaxID=988 RepID=UPI003002A8D0